MQLWSNTGLAAMPAATVSPAFLIDPSANTNVFPPDISRSAEVTLAAFMLFTVAKAVDVALNAARSPAIKVAVLNFAVEAVLNAEALIA